MQPYSLYNTFPRDALSYGEEQAWGLFKLNLQGLNCWWQGLGLKKYENNFSVPLTP